MATNWVDEVLSGATSTGSKTLSLDTGNTLSVANSESESIFTVTSDTTNGGYTSILGIENQEAVLFLGADNADDAGDAWEIHADTSGNFKIGNRTSGTGSPTRANTFTNSLTIDSSRNITVGVDDTGYDVKFFGATSGSFLLWDESDDALELTDSTPIKIGDGGDMTIYHDGSHSYLTNSTGTMKIATESSGIAVTIGHTTSVTTIADELDVTGTVDINDATDASSKTTGALKVAGGVGITKKLYVGTDLDVDGTANLDVVDIDGAVDMASTLTVGGNVDITATTDSSDISGDTGALRCEGGASIAKKLYVGGNAIFGEAGTTTSQVTIYNNLSLTQVAGDTAGQPNFVITNYDVGNAAGSEMLNITWVTSKSDSASWGATDADASLGRIAVYGSDGSDKKWAGQFTMRQQGTYNGNSTSGTAGIPSEWRINSQARLTDNKGVTASNLTWGASATANDTNLANLILNGTGSTPAAGTGNQIFIKNGTIPSAHVDNFTIIGSKDSAGTGTDTKATLSLFCEEDVDATALDAVGTLTTRIPIWVNGTCYWLYLDPV